MGYCVVCVFVVASYRFTVKTVVFSGHCFVPIRTLFAKKSAQTTLQFLQCCYVYVCLYFSMEEWPHSSTAIINQSINQPISVIAIAMGPFYVSDIIRLENLCSYWQRKATRMVTTRSAKTFKFLNLLSL